MTTDELVKKLNAKFAGATFTALANAGNWPEAQNNAAEYAMWGIWEQIGEAAGLPYSADDKKKFCDAWMERRKKSFKTQKH